MEGQFRGLISYLAHRTRHPKIGFGALIGQHMRGCTRAQPDSPPRTLVVWYRCIGKDFLGSLYYTSHASLIDISLTRAQIFHTDPRESHSPRVYEVGNSRFGQVERLAVLSAYSGVDFYMCKRRKNRERVFKVQRSTVNLNNLSHSSQLVIHRSSIITRP